MTDRHIEKMIEEAEHQAEKSAFIGARLMGLFSLLLTPFVFLNGLTYFAGCLVAVCGFVTGCLWMEGRKFKDELMRQRARTIWQKLDYIGTSDERPSFKERELLKNIGCIYDRDPHGKILPLSQAIRLTLAWKQQQKRLQSLESHIQQLQNTRTTLREKQKLLREFGDENEDLERALADLSSDIAPLESSRDAFRASCARLEALIASVDATVRRRELHREVGELTARLPSGRMKTSEPFEATDEQLDLERQIGREIETYLRLERETEAHLRDL